MLLLLLYFADDGVCWKKPTHYDGRFDGTYHTRTQCDTSQRGSKGSLAHEEKGEEMSGCGRGSF